VLVGYSTEDGKDNFTKSSETPIPESKESLKEGHAMWKFLVVVLFSCSLQWQSSAVFAEGETLSAPPFPVVNKQQTELYHIALRGIFPGMADSGITQEIASLQEAVGRSTNGFLAKGRALYGLPPKPISIKWDLVGRFIGEASSDGQTWFNLIVALKNPELFLRSVSPHEVAHILYCEKYECDSAGWTGNASHDQKWAGIMRDLAGFVDSYYPEEVVRITIQFTMGLIAVAGERREEWIVAANLARQDPTLQLNPVLRALFLARMPLQQK